MNKFMSINLKIQIVDNKKRNYTILSNKVTNGIFNTIRKNTFSLFPKFYPLNI